MSLLEEALERWNLQVVSGCVATTGQFVLRCRECGRAVPEGEPACHPQMQAAIDFPRSESLDARKQAESKIEDILETLDRDEQALLWHVLDKTGMDRMEVEKRLRARGWWL